VTQSYGEYELLALYEWSVAYNPVINSVNAATTSLTPKIAWNYNWVFVKTINYIIPVPSIITAEPWSIILNWTNIKSQVITNWTNIPNNTITQTSTWWLNIKLSAYTWSITSKSSTWAMISAVQQIQWAYSWTTISSQSNIAYILNQTTNDELIALWNITILKWQKPLTIVSVPKLYPSCTWSGQIKTSTNTYWSCDTANIIVCSWDWTWYEISACNVWTNIAWTWTASYWEYFQWWRNKWFPYSDTSQQPTQIQNYNANNDIYWFVWNNPLLNNDWIQTPNLNLWWDNSWNGTSVQRQWPCINWYHVPSISEWSWIHTAWLWWSNNVDSWINISNDLLLPMNQERYPWNGNMSNTNYWNYWSSSPIKFMYFFDTQVLPFMNGVWASGYWIRCFKN